MVAPRKFGTVPAAPPVLNRELTLSPSTSSRTYPVARQFLASLGRELLALVPWAVAAPLLLALGELLLLEQSSALDIIQSTEFVLLAFGLTAIVTLPALLTFATFTALTHTLAGRTQAPRLAATIAFGLGSLPYALWLGRFTFSGPRVVGLSYQPLLVAAATMGLAIAFALSLFIHLHRARRPLLQPLYALVALTTSIVSRLLNQEVIPGQYEPLHTLLSVATTLGLLLFLSKIAWLVSRRAPRLSRVRLLLLALLVAGPAAATLYLPHAMRAGALIAQSSVTPRYLVVATEDRFAGASKPNDELLRQLKPKVDSARSLEARRRRSRERPNIVIFFIDNVSPGHVGYLGYRRRPTTPNVDAMVAKGTIFTQAYSSIPHTRLFNTSLLMGRYSHLSAPDRVSEPFIRNAVPNLLRREGYRSMAHTWFELSASADFKADRWGFDTYVPPPTPEQEEATEDWPPYPMPRLLERVGQHLDDARRSRSPVFLWLHLIHPHGRRRESDQQYHAAAEFPYGTSLDERYDSAIASADQWLAPLQRLLDDKLTHPENTYFVFGSDHGSGINRFGKKVSKTTWQDHVHVPLAMVGPQIPKGHIDFAVDSALDLAATVLDLAGIDPPKDYDGISLLPLATKDFKPKAPRPLVVASPPQWEGVVYGTRKLVRNKGTLSLFDLAVDPDERHDIAEQEPALARQLERLAHEELKRRMAVRAGSKAKTANRGDED